MRVAQRLLIDAPRQAVWDLISDGRSYADFMADTDRWDVVGEQASGCGARWAVRLPISVSTILS